MYVPVTSKQYICIPVEGPEGVDLTQYPVQVALVLETAGEPALNAYQPGVWIDGEAALQILPGTYPPGMYMAWALLTAGNEAPVVQSGRVRIGDGSSPAGTPGAPPATWVTSVNGQAGTVVLPVGGTLTSEASIPVVATDINDFALTLTGNATLQNPTGLTDWQIIRFHIYQGPGGPWTLSYGSMFNFGLAGEPQLSQATGDVDIIGFQYDPNLNALCYMGAAVGF